MLRLRPAKVGPPVQPSSFSLAALALALLAGLAGASMSRPARGEDVVIPGSGNPEYVLTQLAEAFQRRQSAHRISIPASTGSAGALREVENGSASLGRVGRPLRPEETRRGLAYVPLGHDPVVFVAGAAVDLRSVTLRQMLDVFSGKITDWRELSAKPGPIRAIGREAGDAARSVLNRHSPAFEKLAYGSDVKIVHLDTHVYMLLDRFGTSLAFINRSGTPATKTKVAILALDGVEPTPANVASGKYPLTLEFGLIHRSGALTEGGRAFIDYLRTPEATQILRANGVAPVPVRPAG